MRTIRRAAGIYETSENGRTVTITHFPEFRGWIAQAGWDRNWCSDPVPTKREAAESAARMLARA